MSPGTFLPAVHRSKRFPAPGSVQQIPPAVLQRLTPTARLSRGPHAARKRPRSSGPQQRPRPRSVSACLHGLRCSGQVTRPLVVPSAAPALPRPYPPVSPGASLRGDPLLGGFVVFFFPAWRVAVGPGRSGEPTFQGRLLLFAPHVGACREPGRGAAARRLCLGSRSRPLLRSRITPLPGRAARGQEGGGEGGEAGRRSA